MPYCKNKDCELYGCGHDDAHSWKPGTKSARERPDGYWERWEWVEEETQQEAAPASEEAKKRRTSKTEYTQKWREKNRDKYNRSMREYRKRKKSERRDPSLTLADNKQNSSTSGVRIHG